MSGFFDYFQVSGLALFLFLFVGRTVYLRRRKKVTAITLSTGNKGTQGILEVSLFVAVNVWIAEVLLYALHRDFRIFPWPLDIKLIDSMPGQVIGVVLAVLGFVIFTLALVTLGDSWRLGIDEKTPGELITRGIYSISRNPVYIFFALYFLGTFLINGAVIFLLFTGLVVFNLHYQILGEEKFLQRRYGQKYRDYYAITGRYFTWRKTPGNTWANLHFSLHRLISRACSTWGGKL